MGRPGSRPVSGRVCGAGVRRLGAGVAAVLMLCLAMLVTPPSASASGASGATPPGKAWVRVGHFVPGMGAVSIQAQPIGSGPATTLTDGATYGQVSTYRQLDPGDYTVTVRLSSSSAAAPMLSRSLEVERGQARTVAVLGTADAPRLAVLSDDLTTPDPGTARVRVLSASDQAGPVTVAAVDGPTIADGAVQGQATDYATVPAGTWTLQLTSSSDGAAMTTLQNVSIRSGSIYTVVALDDGDRPARLDVVTDAAGAVQAPRGGAHTGLGGTAPRSNSSIQIALLGFAGACALTVGAAGRARSRRCRRVLR